MDEQLKALCLEVLTDNIGSERFTNLLLKTGVPLDTVEWDVANKILEKGEEIRSSLGRSGNTMH